MPRNNHNKLKWPVAEKRGRKRGTGTLLAAVYLARHKSKKTYFLRNMLKINLDELGVSPLRTAPQRFEMIKTFKLSSFAFSSG
jgi:hypothetical protein